MSCAVLIACESPRVSMQRASRVCAPLTAAARFCPLLFKPVLSEVEASSAGLGIVFEATLQQRDTRPNPLLERKG